MGVRNGDIITEVNGIAIDSPAEGAEIIREMSVAEEYHVIGIGPDGAEKSWDFVPEG